MSRKSAISELHSEEATNSPLRRSTRIVNGNGAAAAIGTRRTSQTTEPEVPAKVTRSRRGSAQSVEDKAENKPSTRPKRASTLADQEPQKETTPARRGRKSSVTSEPSSEKEQEKPKPVRGRRPSKADSEDNEEKPQKTAPVRGRRSSATVDPEPEVKVAVKTPARTTTRRRSSATDNVVAEEASTPIKRVTRGRRASDTEDIIDEAKKPTTRGRRKSINQEEETKIEEAAKPASRRGRRSSTDNVEINTMPKTPGRTTRRTSFDLETETPVEEKMDSQKNKDVTEKDISPVILKDITVKVTPLKKRKLLDKVEAELDLSIINESCGDISSSKEDELLDETTHESQSLNKSINDKADESSNTKISHNLLTFTSISQLSPSGKELSGELKNETTPRKSPRLHEKISTKNTSEKEIKNWSPKTPSKEIKTRVNKLISSGSDSSFRLHLSNVSITESVPNSSQDDGDVLNTSKESTGSNKENVDLTDARKMKDITEKSPAIPIQEPITVARISNVFKPNQKEYSFMEPMEVDMSPDDSVMDKSIALDESSVIFNRKVHTRDTSMRQENEIEQQSLTTLMESEIKCQTKIVDDLKSNYTETEGSDNIFIEETDNTVDIGIKPNTRSSKIDASTTTDVRSESPLNTNNPDVINDLTEKVKVMVTRTSSSPMKVKRRRTKSPPFENNSTDSESDCRENLRVSKPSRRSKSKSETPSPKDLKDTLPKSRSSRSKSKSPNLHTEKPEISRRSKSKSPALQKIADHSILSGNVAPRIKSVSPVQSGQTAQPVTNFTGDYSESKKRLDEKETTSIDQSFEKSKGYEEVLISNEKININVLNDEQGSQEEKELPGLKAIENLELPTSISEQKTGQNKTDRIKILATTNNDKSESNTDNDDGTHAQIKHSDSTHYDFDLPSDEDDAVTELNTSNCEEQKIAENDDSKTAESDLDDVFEEKKDADISGSEEAELEIEETNSNLKKTDSNASKIYENRSEEIVETDNADISKVTDNEKSEKNNEDSVVTKNCLEQPKFSTDSSIVSNQRESLPKDSVSIKIDLPKGDNAIVDKELVENNVEESSDERQETIDDNGSTNNDSPKISSNLTIKSKVDLKIKSISKYSTHSDADYMTDTTNDIPMDEDLITNDDASSNISNNIQETCDESFTDSDIISKCEPKYVDSLKSDENITVGNEDANKDQFPKNLPIIKATNISEAQKNKPLHTTKSNEIINSKLELSSSFSSASTEDIKNANNSEDKEGTSVQEVSLARTDIKKIESRKSKEEDAGNKKVKKEDNTPAKSVAVEDRKPLKPRSLDKFASIKLSEYLKTRAKEIEESDSEEDLNEESESEKDYDQFIDGMAEEGEEDTPSEDSNQIIDEGESIGFSDSECADSEEYDENDSFICDDEESELLLGEEYDISSEKESTKKKSRIIDASTLGDDDIIKVPKKKADNDVPKKRRSRIISISDSSSEEETNLVKTEQLEMEEENNRSSNKSIIIIDESKDSGAKDEIAEASKTSMIEDIVIEAEQKPEVLTTEENSMMTTDNESNTESLLQNISALNTSLQKRHRKSSLSIQENIVIDGIKDPRITERINNLVESFCSSVTKGEIALNLSLEYEDPPEMLSTKETEAVHILSNVRICPDISTDAEPELQEQNAPPESENENEPNTSIINQSEDLRNVLNRKKLKRRLSKSLSEVYEEEKKSKKRKKNKNKPKKSNSEEKLTNKKSSKKTKSITDSSEVLKAGSLSLMSQLITDVKNRPKRIIKPTTTTPSKADSSWTITTVRNPKPSTSPASKHERMKVLPKLHPKDFKNRLLTDPKRVKRVDTKTLLKKKGA